MNKSDYIDKLFNNIKDNIELDSDVIALETLLQAKLNINIKDSVEKWQYLMEKYSIDKLEDDIDFTPLLNIFPTELIKRIGIRLFFELLRSIDKNKALIYENLFDVFNDKCGIYAVIKDLIIRENTYNEKETVKTVISHSDAYPKGIFDITYFLKRIILYHLNNNYQNLELLIEFTDIPDSEKDKSVLKTLLLDYMQ